MNAEHAWVVSKAVEIVKLSPKSPPTIARLAGFLGADESMVLRAMADAPDHVREAFGLAPARKINLAAFRLRR
ncbi:MAG: hypothetical protein Q7R40_16895 [Phaeospirillum sp.]|nr:hypothetical protein [Phaeospirillum sp.]